MQWSTKSTYVDADTGEYLTKQEAQNKYYIIKKNKHATVSKDKGYIYWTYECKRKLQQLEIRFDTK